MCITAGQLLIDYNKYKFFFFGRSWPINSLPFPIHSIQNACKLYYHCSYYYIRRTVLTLGGRYFLPGPFTDLNYGQFISVPLFSMRFAFYRILMNAKPVNQHDPLPPPPYTEADRTVIMIPEYIINYYCFFFRFVPCWNMSVLLSARRRNEASVNRARWFDLLELAKIYRY